MIEQDRIIKINIEEEMKSSHIDYSMSVIVSRALPDVRDGFKPVHRRILFGMMGLGNTSDKPYKNSARVVGAVSYTHLDVYKRQKIAAACSRSPCK